MIPQKKEHFSQGFPVGYKKEPKTGKYRWAAFLLMPLSKFVNYYATQSVSRNVKWENHKPIDCTVESILERKHKPKTKDANLSMNGYLFRKDRQGFMAEITQKFLMTVNGTRNS